MIDYLIASLLAFIGLFAGLAVGYLAKEELAPGKKYLLVFSYVTLVAIGLATALFNTQATVIVLLGMLLISHIRKPEVLFAAVPAFLYIAWLGEGFEPVASLCLLCSLPLGSLYLAEHPKKTWEKAAVGLLGRYWPYLIVAFAACVAGSFFN